MNSELGLACYIIGLVGSMVVFCLIPIPIIFLSHLSLDEFEIKCGVSQPEFRIIPFDINHRNDLTLTFANSTKWPEGVIVGMYDPESLVKNRFVNSHKFELASLFLSEDSIKPIGYYSLSRGAVINISFTSMHSVSMALMHRNDYYPLFLYGEEVSYFGEEYMTTAFDRLKRRYSDSIISKAVFKCCNRTCSVSWTVPETTQYALVFGNDSPFPITVYGCNISMESPSPIGKDPIFVCEQKGPSCVLHIPNDYNKDNISIVMYDDCYHFGVTTAGVSVGPSDLVIVCVVVGLYGPFIVFVIMFIIGLIHM